MDPHQTKFNVLTLVRWKYPAGHTWSAPVNNRTRDGKRKGSNCGQCSRRVSCGENKVASFISSLNYSLIRSSRSLIKPYELDIADEALTFAVEYNGVYWHSEERTQATRSMSSYVYHAMKLRLCAAKSIDLLFLWQDDWENEKEIVQAAIVDYLTTGHRSDILSRLDPKENVL